MIRFSSVSFRSVSFRFDNERTDARLGERRRDRVDSIRFDSVRPLPRIHTRSIDREPRVRPVPLDRHRPGARDTVPYPRADAIPRRFRLGAARARRE